MIQAKNLTKRYGGFTAVDNISFEVKPGEIMGFLGPNGAGKTTTLRILACYMPATGGTVTLGGLDVFRDSLEIRRRIGYLPENVPLYTDMRVIEYLKFRGRIKGLSGRKLRTRIDEVLTSCGLAEAEVRHAIIGNLSKGFHQRVGLADALVADPDVLILDEPTIGLDPNQIRQIRHLIKNLGGRHTVLLSSHILPEVEMVCDRVLIINKGRIVAADTAANLVSRDPVNTHLIAEIKGAPDAVLAKLRAIAGVGRIDCVPGEEWTHYTLECAPGSDVRAAVFRSVTANGWVLRELREERRNLEDVFVSLTREEKP